ncbi:histidine--tRNA ligase [Candidatus Marsarchaeota archaeon]|nr:histidine--tRNA ligase [Candidatus Marsarchaeota archaeon]
MPFSLPRGVRDYGPSEAIALQETISVVEEVFKRFGFYPIMTPALESIETLNSKVYGEESTKEIFLLQDGESGLRFDLTVPLARFVAGRKDLPLPFKRYQIDRAWRKDEPQHMRFREFIQADIDIIGVSETKSDAEVIAATAKALEALGIDYTIFINHRVLLSSILDFFKIPAPKHPIVMRILDKMAKIQHEELISQMVSAGIGGRLAEDLFMFLTEKKTNSDLLGKIAGSLGGETPELKAISELLEILMQYGLRGKIEIDLSLARGLDYYTGFIYEFVSFREGKRLPTIASGGRYDNLIGAFSKDSLPAVGCSVGISRVVDLINSGSRKTAANIFVAYITEEDFPYALGVANSLRESGKYVDMNLHKRSISKQLEYVNALGIMHVAIIGKIERDAGKVKLRNMLSGEEELVAVADINKKVR